MERRIKCEEKKRINKEGQNEDRSGYDRGWIQGRNIKKKGKGRGRGKESKVVKKERETRRKDRGKDRGKERNGGRDSDSAGIEIIYERR